LPKLSDTRIASILQSGIGQAIGYGGTSRLSFERERVSQYYDAEKPGLMHKGDAEYRSMDVYTGVESMKAQLLEVFSGNRRPVVFNTQPNESDMQAKARTDYITNVIFSQNPGFQTFQTILHDGLVARNGIAKVWWETKKETEFYDLSAPAEEQIVSFLANDPTAEIDEISYADDKKTMERVRFKCARDRSQVRFKAIPPEEFGISAMSDTIEDAELVFHRHLMTKSELLKHGYDPAMVDALTDEDRLWGETEPEVVQRFSQTDDIIGLDVDEDGQESRRRYMLYECYAHLDMDGTGESQLWKVDVVGNTVLDKEPVSHKPFIAFCALPRAHAFWGTNYGMLLIPTQNARTYLTRAIVNHALITTNPRWQVVRGGLLNPRELMENRLGGIVNVANEGSVTPLQQSGLNPFVFQTMQQLQQSGEDVSGISSLSQGLNKDAISNQNSQGMVQELISVSQVRQKIIARNFAEGFLRGLYSLVYRLVLENETPQKVIQTTGGQGYGGNWVMAF